MVPSDPPPPPSSPNPQPSQRVTLADIAKAIGVTHATVSMALNNNPRISEARRKEIRAIAQQMGYQPNAVATTLAYLKRNSSKITSHHSVLAWINTWPNPNELRARPEFDHYWRGAEACAEKFGYRLEEFDLSGEMSPHRVEQILTARSISGVLIAPCLDDQVAWKTFHWERFSVIRIGRRRSEPHAHTVTADQMSNTMLAFRCARERGYKRIGYVHSRCRPYRYFDAGFWKAHLDVPESERLPICVLNESEPSTMQSQLESWLQKWKPDAIIAGLAEIPEMVKRSGLRVPQDVGLISETVLEGSIDAGIHQNPEEIGRVAVLMLISLLHDNEVGIPSNPREVLITGKWVEGKSLPDRSLPALSAAKRTPRIF